MQLVCTLMSFAFNKVQPAPHQPWSLQKEAALHQAFLHTHPSASLLNDTSHNPFSPQSLLLLCSTTGVTALLPLI